MEWILFEKVFGIDNRISSSRDRTFPDPISASTTQTRWDAGRDNEETETMSLGAGLC